MSIPLLHHDMPRRCGAFAHPLRLRPAQMDLHRPIDPRPLSWSCPAVAAASTRCAHRPPANSDSSSQQQQQQEERKRPWRQPIPPPWPKVWPVLFHATQPEELFGTRLVPDAPLWRFLLLTDGQVMLHLSVLVGPVRLRVVERGGGNSSSSSSRVVGAPRLDAAAWKEVSALGDHPLAPLLAELITGSRRIGGGGGVCRRQARVRDGRGRVLLHATSWWDAGVHDAVMMGEDNDNSKEGELSLWSAFEACRMHVARRVRGVHYGLCPALEPVFGCDGPFWGRYYVFKQHARPIVVVYEVLSPHLAAYAGAMPRPRDDLLLLPQRQAPQQQQSQQQQSQQQQQRAPDHDVVVGAD